MSVAGVGQKKTVAANNLIIKNNIMCFGETRLQISNISSIANGKEDIAISPSAFPAIMIGSICAMIAKSSRYFEDLLIAAAIILIAYGIAMVVALVIQIKMEKSLIITMNSGQTYRITVVSEYYLRQILDDLEKIIMNGGVEGKSINIDLSNAKITTREFKMDTNVF